MNTITTKDGTNGEKLWPVTPRRPLKKKDLHFASDTGAHFLMFDLNYLAHKQ
jgi:hypothetical protein